MEEPRNTNGFLGVVAGVLSIVLMLATLVVVIGWLSGDIRSWSMWLAWVPAIFLLPVTLIGLLLGAVVHGRVGTTICALQLILFLCVGSIVAGSDWGMI